ncbi:hypothetical protein [Alkalihalobacillus trypoxylicola]|nr:hypothetical protein [Alkalihalobacillus trypoxylicola]
MYIYRLIDEIMPLVRIKAAIMTILIASIILSLIGVMLNNAISFFTYFVFIIVFMTPGVIAAVVLIIILERIVRKKKNVSDKNRLFITVVVGGILSFIYMIIFTEGMFTADISIKVMIMGGFTTLLYHLIFKFEQNKKE